MNNEHDEFKKSYDEAERRLAGMPDELLDDVRAFIRRFCAFPSNDALTAVTLWAAHAHMVEHFHTTPRLAVLSPEPGSGKTRVLEVLDLLVPESMFSLNPSPATIFRTLANKKITLLLDEVDAIFRKRGKDDTNEELRGLLNSGYKRGASVPRCVGTKHEVQSFDVFCATALAGIGDLPDTVMTRSVILRMRRRAPNELVEPFRTRKHEPEGHELRERLAEWARNVGQQVGESWPEMPDGIVDRPAEVWEPLLAVADAAGGHWPAIARTACLSLCRVAEERKASLGIRLLSDLWKIFGEADAMHTETILEKLCNGEDLEADAPWGDLHGKPIGVRTLASMLKKYSVSPQKVKIAGRSLQGYRREQLWDAWVRYTPSLVSAKAEPPEPTESQQPEQRAMVPEVPEVPEIRRGGTAYFAEGSEGTRYLWRPKGNGKSGQWKGVLNAKDSEEAERLASDKAGGPAEVRLAGAA